MGVLVLPRPSLHLPLLPADLTTLHQRYAPVPTLTPRLPASLHTAGYTYVNFVFP